MTTATGPAIGQAAADGSEVSTAVLVAPARPRVRGSRLALLAVTVAALAGAAAALPLESVRHAAAGLGTAGMAAAVVAGALLIAALVPRTAVTVACGALFGVQGGFWCALSAALLGATITYAAGRWAGGGLLCARLNSRMHRLDGWLARRGLLAVLVVRMLPLAPYGLVGYAYGTTSVPRRHYFLGTAIGATPSCFSYAVVGAAVIAPGETNPTAFLPAAAGMLISTAAAWHWRRQHRRARCGAGQLPARPGPVDAAAVAVTAAR